MLNQTGVTKVEGVTRKTILVDEKNSTAFSVVVSNDGVDAGDDGRKIIKAGTPVYGNLTARNTAFTVSGESGDATATASVQGTGITAATVDADTFGTAVSNIGDRYVFIASVADTVVTWTLDGTTVTLNTYGIEATGTAADGDKITVMYSPAAGSTPVGIILHDVDVTKGTANSQVVVFGFIDISKLDTDVQAMITDEVKAGLKMIQFVK